jgi:ABC-type lipoprotein export system ATPase subunit
MVTHNYEIAKKTDRMLELKRGKLTNYTFLDTNKER